MGNINRVLKCRGTGCTHMIHDRVFVYSSPSIESLKDNLRLMKPELQSFMESWNEITNENNTNSGTECWV